MSKNYTLLPLNFRCVLDLPARDQYIVPFLNYDVSRFDAFDMTALGTATLSFTTVPLSNIWIWVFNPATPDWLEIANAQAANLNFVASDFSCAAWIFIDDLTADRCLFCMGDNNADGWYMYVAAAGGLQFITNQAGANQISGSNVNTILINRWYQIGATRQGANVRLYSNGADVTSLLGAHVNPLVSARDFHIGIRDNEVNMPWSCYIWRPRAWTRTLSARDMSNLFETERKLFGV